MGTGKRHTTGVIPFDAGVGSILHCPLPATRLKGQGESGHSIPSYVRFTLSTTQRSELRVKDMYKGLSECKNIVEFEVGLEQWKKEGWRQCAGCKHFLEDRSCGASALTNMEPLLWRICEQHRAG